MKQALTAFGGFLLLFLLFFLPFPLSGSLTGDLDTIANLAMFKQMKLVLDQALYGISTGAICYPTEKIWLYFGVDFFAGAIHVFFNYLGVSDLWANWLFISIVFALNATALYYFLRTYVPYSTIALAGSLLFCLSHFTLGNLENPNVLFFFFFFYSLTCYRKFTQSDDARLQTRLLWKATVAAAIQIYFSPYLFLLHVFVWGSFIVHHEWRNISWQTIRRYLVIPLVYVVFTIPYLKYFVFPSEVNTAYNSIASLDATKYYGLTLSDFIRVLPNHLYRPYVEVWDNPFMTRIKAAYLGIFFYGFALLGLWKTRARLFWAFLTVSGVAIAFGPYINADYGMREMIPSVLFPLYEYFHFGDILRLPFRGFFITVFALTFLATQAMLFLKERFRSYPVWMAIPFLILVENVPVPLPIYDHRPVLQPSSEYIEYIRDKEDAVLLELPTDLFRYGYDRREYVLMYWQTMHRQKTMNGYLAFIPEPRMDMYETFKPGFTEADLMQFLERYDITTLVFHQDLVLTFEEAPILDMLRTCPMLEEETTISGKHIFKVVRS